MLSRHLHPLIFVILLLFVQGHWFAHKLDFAAHEPGETCELCLHLSALDHVTNGSDATTVSTGTPEAANLLNIPLWVRRLLTSFSARGPPPAALPHQHCA